ncbi:hypothetical protein [Bacillus sp. AFS041924]|uniref:hypothetical protein n=1 Tax=Bacillus sp. AFS041924 TaxID=2033503 RepID=UPI000BFCF299|nr:hypothetical protein [Bacillus sp. AFS041924]PGS48313.1 hypothetical protein COC46_18630 [Bacillus sp. AFS041924]
MFSIGNYVIFSLDGAVGTVMETKDNQCLVVWEDRVCSWASFDLLKKISCAELIQIFTPK